MKKLLLIEDSTLVVKVMRHLIQEQALFEVDFAVNMAQARALLEENAERYFAAVVDLNLPDANDGDAVDLVNQYALPILVLTASMDAEKRERLFEKGIVDYVIKENRYAYEYAVRLMIRLYKNHLIKVLVVDDSTTARKQAVRLLQKYRFQVTEADNAKQAIHKLVAEPDIRLVVTDYNMPEVDGFDLVRLIRSKYDKEHLCIIGLSGEGNAELSAKFIKNGANDFLRKPFNQEEFYCRVIHNIESVEAFERLQQAKAYDEATGLIKRNGFINQVNQQCQAYRGNKGYAMALIAIDDFDDFCHLAFNYGDSLIASLVERLKIDVPHALIGRISAKHIGIFLLDILRDDMLNMMDEFTQEFSETPLPTEQGEVKASLGVGLIHSDKQDAHSMLKIADALLRKAQEQGHNNLEYQ